MKKWKQKRGGRAAGRVDEWFPPNLFSVKRHLSILFRWTVYTYIVASQAVTIRACMSKEIKARILVRVLSESHTAPETVSLDTSCSIALSEKWGSCHDRHSNHCKYHLFSRKYIAGVVFCRSFRWCAVGGGVGQTLVGVSMVSSLKWTRYVSYTLAVVKIPLFGLSSEEKIHKIKTKQTINIKGPSLLKTFFCTGRKARNKNNKPRMLAYLKTFPWFHIRFLNQDSSLTISGTGYRQQLQVH